MKWNRFAIFLLLFNRLVYDCSLCLIEFSIFVTSWNRQLEIYIIKLCCWLWLARIVTDMMLVYNKIYYIYLVQPSFVLCIAMKIYFKIGNTISTIFTVHITSFNLIRLCFQMTYDKVNSIKNNTSGITLLLNKSLKTCFQN